MDDKVDIRWYLGGEVKVRMLLFAILFGILLREIRYSRDLMGKELYKEEKIWI